MNKFDNINIAPLSTDNGFSPPVSSESANATIQNYHNHGNAPQISVNNGTVISGDNYNAPVFNAPIYILNPSDPAVASSFSNLFPRTTVSLPAQGIWSSLNDEMYNIFVLENETFMDNAFCMPIRFCLDEDTTDPHIRKKYADLDDNAKNAIYNMPCIFAGRNLDDFKKAGTSQPVVIGRIKEIIPQTMNIKFHFDAYKSDVGQKLFNDHSSDIGLLDAPIRNELDIEHWSIKQGNLKQFINNHGIIIS